MKKILSLIIVMTFLLSIGTQSIVVADDISSREISPSYVSLMGVSSYLDIDSLGIATCTAKVSQRLSDGSCEMIMKLQKLNSGDWDTIATWSKEGTTACVSTKYRAVSSGTYRLYVIGKAYDSSGNFIESGTVYSINVTY